VPPKPDADAIRAVLAERDAALVPYLGGRAWWTKRAFHFTDVRNAAGILNHAALLCRGQATEQGLMLVENADREVIAKRADLTDQYARLYFRPLTPTQYRNEGTRPAADRPPEGRHCPVPVFFIFKLAEILVLEGTHFTQCAAHREEAEVYDSAEELRGLPWRDIYSIGVMPAARKQALTGARNAEILVENSLNLTDVTKVVCRTGPERDTLLHLLTEETRAAWREKIVQAGKAELFNGRWTHVQTVTWVGNALVFAFSLALTPATFQVAMRITDPATGGIRYQNDRAWTFTPETRALRIELGPDAVAVEAMVTLDGALVYNAVVVKEALLAR
jgi:hypothetical protein